MSPQPWLKCRRRILSVLPWVLTVLPCLARAQWVDTFDTINPAWVTDRYAPAGFQSVFFDGDNRLQVTIDQAGSAINRPSADSSSFYNTQGDQRPVGITGGWSLSAQVYVPSAFDTTTGQLVRSSLWAESGTTAANGEYAIIGFTNASPTDPLNPEATDRSFRFQVYTGINAEDDWFDVGVPAVFAFNTWTTLEASGNATTFEFSVDGTVVYTEPADGDDLQTAFIEAYNFGQTDANGLNSYSVDWDNVAASAVIPEPANFALVAGLATFGLAWARRRISHRITGPARNEFLLVMNGHQPLR
jgi:hypothetical protein